jgi:hypothetical protein
VFDVPDDVRPYMSVPCAVVKFNFYDPTDLLVRLLVLSPIAAREENLAFFPEDSDTLHDYCHGDRLRRIHNSMPVGSAALTAVLFFDEINRDAKGFASGDGAIVVGGFFRRRVRESTYSKVSVGTFPQVGFPQVDYTMYAHVFRCSVRAGPHALGYAYATEGLHGVASRVLSGCNVVKTAFA